MLDVIKENKKGIENVQNKNSKNIKTLTPPTLKNDDTLEECLGTPPEVQKRAHAAPTKFKSPIVKQIPPDILKTHSKGNIPQDKTPSSVSKKKKGKKKKPMKWSEMFQWRPKNIQKNIRNVSLEEEPH
jgi:hypothetical protein